MKDGGSWGISGVGNLGTTFAFSEAKKRRERIRCVVEIGEGTVVVR